MRGWRCGGARQFTLGELLIHTARRVRVVVRSVGTRQVLDGAAHALVVTQTVLRVAVAFALVAEPLDVARAGCVVKCNGDTSSFTDYEACCSSAMGREQGHGEQTSPLEFIRVT